MELAKEKDEETTFSELKAAQLKKLPLHYRFMAKMEINHIMH